MRLRILVDNTTFIDQYYLGEPGLSFYLEADGKHYLLDTGYSDIILKNAAAMHINLKQIDTIVLSHGHNDHTRGLCYLKGLYQEKLAPVSLLAHPQAFRRRRDEELDIGLPVPETELVRHFQIRKETEPIWLSPRLVYLGEIERNHAFEQNARIGEIEIMPGGWQPDLVQDDTALVYKAKQGLIILTGCSHAGICNIVSQAIRVCKTEKIAAIVGGFHLLKAEEARLKATIACLQAYAPQAIYACHCTDFAAKLELAKQLPVYEAGVGMSLAWD